MITNDRYKLAACLFRHLTSAYLKNYLSDFDQVALFDTQNAENEYERPFDTLKHRFIDFNKIVFQ
jgi:hypothetical protein